MSNYNQWYMVSSLVISKFAICTNQKKKYFTIFCPGSKSCFVEFPQKLLKKFKKKTQKTKTKTTLHSIFKGYHGGFGGGDGVGVQNLSGIHPIYSHWTQYWQKAMSMITNYVMWSKLNESGAWCIVFTVFCLKVGMCHFDMCIFHSKLIDIALVQFYLKVASIFSSEAKISIMALEMRLLWKYIWKSKLVCPKYIHFLLTIKL